jgi:hypothetical protein
MLGVINGTEVVAKTAPARPQGRHPMRSTATLLIAGTVGLLTRVRGGGAALPGLVVERLNPDFVARPLAPPPLGTAVI